jgi:N-acetylglucosamine-6-sulfatase
MLSKKTTLFFNVFIFIFLACEQESTKNAEIGILTASWDERFSEKVEFLNSYDSIIQGRMNIVFIGNSLTHFFETENSGIDEWNLLSQKFNIFNLGFAGDQTGNTVWRLQNGISLDNSNPEHVVLMIGANNILSDQYKPSNIASGIEKILYIIHSQSYNSRILLFSILPFGAENSRFNDKISETNDCLMKIDMDYVQYVDLARDFIHADGGVVEELYRTDLVHLSPLGYRVWRERIERLIGGLSAI